MWMAIVFFIVMDQGVPKIADVVLAGDVFQTESACSEVVMRDGPNLKWEEGDLHGIDYSKYGYCVHIGADAPAPEPVPETVPDTQKSL